MGYDLKYGKVTLENKEIPEDEPLFVLRGQDIIASAFVKIYAVAYLALTNDRQGFNKIMAQARSMDEWPNKKIPD